MASNPTFQVTKRIVIVGHDKVPRYGQRVTIGVGYECVLITSVLGHGRLRQILLVPTYAAASMAHYDGYGPMP